jgi:hypothetical protein
MVWAWAASGAPTTAMQASNGMVFIFRILIAEDSRLPHQTQRIPALRQPSLRETPKNGIWPSIVI